MLLEKGDDRQADLVCTQAGEDVGGLRIVARGPVTEIPMPGCLEAGADRGVGEPYRYVTDLCLEAGLKAIARRIAADGDPLAMLGVARVLRLRVPGPGDQAGVVATRFGVGVHGSGTIPFRSVTEVPVVADGRTTGRREVGHVPLGGHLERGDQIIAGGSLSLDVDLLADGVQAGDHSAALLLEDAGDGEAGDIGAGFRVGVYRLGIIAGSAIAEGPGPRGLEAGTGGGVGELCSERKGVERESSVQTVTRSDTIDRDLLAIFGPAGVLGVAVPRPGEQTSVV